MINELLRRMLFLPPQASTVAREIDTLHYVVILTTLAGAAAITLVGAGFLVRYRARGPVLKREDPSARPPLWAEVAVIGGLLSLFCLWWLIGFSQFVRIQVPPEDALTIYVTGKQWMWKFGYPSGEHTIATVYVPTGRPVKLLLTSRDVIHSFYVPDFRIKQDALPGRYTTIWFEVKAPGAHMVLCAEYCGTGHSTMRAQVVALAPDDYARWLAGARQGAYPQTPLLVADDVAGPTELGGGMPGPRSEAAVSVEEMVRAAPLDLIRVGRETAAEVGCLRCHTLDGSVFIGPSWAGLFRATVPLEGGGAVLADEAYLTESMMDPAAKLHAGFRAVMPSYLGRLSPAQVAAIVELVKSLRGAATPAPRRAPPAGAAIAAAPPAGDMEPAPVEPPPREPLPPTHEAAPAVPAAAQEGLPPPGSVSLPLPRLPIRVGGGESP